MLVLPDLGVGTCQFGFFVENLTGTLQVVAQDAKVQVDFNPEVVRSYRLLGYENRRLDDDEFRDDEVDAGEVGAGHSVTALYELKFESGAEEDQVATVYVRYADPDTGEVSEVSKSIGRSDLATVIEETSPHFRLDAAVAEFAEILRGSYWAQDGNLSDVQALAAQALAQLADDDDVIEFVYLVTQAEEIATNE